MTKQNLWASAVYWICQVYSYKEAAKTENTLTQIMPQFYVQYEVNSVKIEKEIKPVILKLSRKTVKFPGSYSVQDILRRNKVSLQLKIKV